MNDFNEFSQWAVRLGLPRQITSKLQQLALLPYLQNDFSKQTAEDLIYLAEHSALSKLNGHSDKAAIEALATLIKRGILGGDEPTPINQIAQTYSQQPVIYIMQTPAPPQRVVYEEDEEDEGSSTIAWVICILLVLIALAAVIVSGSPELQSQIQLILYSFGL